jgi:hypothetical protein
MQLDSRRFDLNQYPRFESVPKNKVRSGSAGILPCEQNLIPQARGNEIGLPALQLIRSSQENDMGDDMSERDFRDRVSPVTTTRSSILPSRTASRQTKSANLSKATATTGPL